MAKIKKCDHLHIQYDKINDYNYCQDCLWIFEEDEALLFIEKEKDNTIIDEVENILEELNNL